MSSISDRHRRFLEFAAHHAKNSRDPSTHVGCVLVRDTYVISAGFNSFSRGIAETRERLEDRDQKMKLMVHAEMNAILSAAAAGQKTAGTTLYLSATDASGAIWGGAPCTRCLVECIQAGIAEVITYPFKRTPSRWKDDLAFAVELMREAKIGYTEIDP
jgi:dCMP deaminase